METMNCFLRPESMAVTFFIIAFSFVIIRFRARRFEKRKYHPIAGTIFNQLLNFSRLHDYMTDLASQYKTYRLIAPFRSEVYTSDPANVEYILKTKFENYGKGWHYYSIMKDLLGDGIFTVDGEKWRQQRKVSSREFSVRALRDVSSKVFKENAVKLAFVVSESVVAGQSMDIQVNLQKKDILSRFLKLPGANPKYLRDVVLNFVMAGKDTTATTLSWFFYMMCKHPLSQEKAMREIKQVMASNLAANIPEFAASLSEESLEKMHYLHAALSETLRLYPPVPVNPKMCLSDDTLPDGFSVRRGDVVAYQPYAMGRMRFIWGDDAEEFKPERWLDHNGCFRQENPFKFTAFQAGPRICVGREFGYMQMKILSSVLLRFFAFRLSDEGKIVNYRIMINLHIDGGLSLRAIARSDH